MQSWGCSVTSPASAFASRLRISCDSGCEITAMWLNNTTVKVPVHRREQGWFKMEYCINPQLHHNHDIIVWFVIVMKEKNMVLPLYLRKKDCGPPRCNNIPPSFGSVIHSYLKYVYPPPRKCNPQNKCRETKLRDPIWSSSTSLMNL